MTTPKTEQELRELDTFIHQHVFDLKPSMEAAAYNADETGMALWEGDTITKRDIRKFCEQNPQYHYKEVTVCPRYATDPAPAMEVLKKCMLFRNFHAGFDEGIYQIEASHTNGSFITVRNQSFEACVCEFARKLFEK